MLAEIASAAEALRPRKAQAAWSLPKLLDIQTFMRSYKLNKQDLLSHA